MIQIKKNIQLQLLNTLKLPCIASHYVNIDSNDQLVEALEYAEKAHLNIVILSGGSNMLLPEKLNALVIKMNIQGIDVISQTAAFTEVKVGAGQNWHQFVLHSTKQKWYGLQNLALIPGLVGASPVQNIGAYGVEAGEFISVVDVYDREEKSFKSLKADVCHFSYRHSIFKDHPQRYIIVAVTFRLNNMPTLKLAYGDLAKAVGEQQTAENLQQQVICIRQSKLPNPQEYPNVGSFFKNPIVSQQTYDALSQVYPTMPKYIQENGQIKLAAGWLIDQVGWKGKSLGSVGMFAKQALVLVNYEQATLKEVQETYRAVQSDVKLKFNIMLEPEPVLFNQVGQICGHTD